MKEISQLRELEENIVHTFVYLNQKRYKNKSL